MTRSQETESPQGTEPQNQGTRPIQNVIVLGGGSAGYLAAITLKIRIPHLSVTIIHSKDIPIIGVGEGTTFTVPIFLHGYLGVDPAAFHRRVKPTYKLGIRFLWGERDHFHYSFTNQLDHRLRDLSKPNGFFSFNDFNYADLTGALMAHDRAFLKQDDGGPLVDTNVAYHIENRDFVEFLEQCAAEVGVITRDDAVEGVELGEAGVEKLQLRSGETATADLFVDASGFRSELIGKAFEEPFENFESSLFCDRAIAGGWEREEELIKPYTTAETMECGWAWQIEHDHLINRGYVYSSRFLSDELAEKEFRKKNPKVKQTRVINFETGYYRRNWIKNVVGIGNAAGFVEPLEATSLAIICDHMGKLVRALADSDLTIEDKAREYFNRYTERNWRAIRRFLAMHYKFNKRIDNDFWRACWNECDLAGAEEIVDYYQNCGPGVLWASEAMGPADPFGWEGYLVMLVGQKVPHQNQWQPSAEEKKKWSNFSQNLAKRASQGLTIAESTKIIRSDQWSWKKDFYAQAVRW